MGWEPNTKLNDRYSLVRRIGSGGMATVYLAEDEVLRREVAVKLLHGDGPEDAARRFRREAQLAAGLSHPNLVTVFDAFSEEGELVVVMEYVPGTDLSKVLREGPPPRDRGLRILSGVADAIDHVHRAGITHRDVKPANVLLSEDGEIAKLTDLGIARVVEDTSTTQVGAIPGSVLYMAPEQLRGEAVGPPCDVYAFSLLAAEVIGGAPVRDGSPAVISHQITEEPTRDLREVLARTPPPAADVFERGMALDPAERPGAREIADGLARALQAPGRATAAAPTITAPSRTAAERTRTTPDVPAAPPPAPAASRRTRPTATRWLVVPLLALLVGAMAVLLLTSDGGGDAEGGGETTPAADAGDRGGRSDPQAAQGSTSAADSPAAAAVQGFYETAASGDFAAATELASPNLLAQLGGEEGVAATFSTLESIEFEELRTESESETDAQVAFSTTATHTDRTEECTGTATAVATDGAWLVDQLDAVQCNVVG